MLCNHGGRDHGEDNTGDKGDCGGYEGVAEIMAEEEVVVVVEFVAKEKEIMAEIVEEIMAEIVEDRGGDSGRE